MQVNGTNLTMIRGDTESIAITCTKDGVNYLESGDTVYFTVKKRYASEEISLQKIQTVFTDDHKAIFEIEPEDTKGLAFGSYSYDIQLTKFNGEVTTIVEHSTFTLSPEVTHD